MNRRNFIASSVGVTATLAGDVWRTAGDSLPNEAESEAPPATNALPFTNVLYGVAYYHEYMPYERLDQDVDLMKQAGISVVRMGESTWSLWEPEDGKFEYAWMDRVVNAMHSAGIRVIMGTPTYSIPVWMYQKYPEILARPLGGAQVFYGMRQNMDTSNETFRFYAGRMIRNMVQHYRDHPGVIGWQIDNETGAYGASNRDVFLGFVAHLKRKFGSVEALNKAWLLNYWGEDVYGWDQMPTRDSATSTGYKLEWARWQQMRVTEYLSWQARLVRQHRRPDQIVIQDFVGGPRLDANEFEVAKALDIVACNPYHGTQDHFDGASQAMAGDYFRSLKQANYLVTETNAQTIGWDSATQFPPYDGQLRLDVYTHISSGANMVEYWHWGSIHSGQETYWKGVLSHDLEPNRAYAEVRRTAHELKKIGPRLVNLKKQNKVAILYSSDSANAIEFMPFVHTEAPRDWFESQPNYMGLVRQMHGALYRLNVGTDFVFPESEDFSPYAVLIVPALYIADDALLERIARYVHNGGHALMTFKSGFCNENSMVRPVRQPGPLREAAGFSYQEFSNLERPLALAGDPFQAGGHNQVMYWAEFLMLEKAKPLAHYDHPFFGRWPAITRNEYGSGSLLYEGTWLSDMLQEKVLLSVLKHAGLAGPDQKLPTRVRAKHGINAMGQALHFYLNYSSEKQTVKYAHASGTDLLTNRACDTSDELVLQPWDAAIIEETG
jgi:beta-galactosidase